MSEALSAEFDTVAEWTAEAAVSLGSEFYIPAGCRGSGPPAAMAWLLEALGAAAGDELLDCGAGVGGPAAFAMQQADLRPVLLEPEAGACRAAQRLFGLPTVRASALELPFATGSFRLTWSLGVLCTVPDQLRMLEELQRVLTRDGRLGLLVYTAQAELGDESPDGNDFPTDDRLFGLLDRAGLDVVGTATLAEFGDPDPGWRARMDGVDDAMAQRHGEDERWRVAAAQAGRIGELLGAGRLAGRVVVGVARGG